MSLTFQLHHSEPAGTDTPLLAVLLPGGSALSESGLTQSLSPIDAQLGHALSRSVSRRDFRADRDETLLLVGADRGAQRVLLVGLGNHTLDRNSARRAAAIAARQAVRIGTGSITLWAPGADTAGPEVIEGLVIGAAAGSWSYTDLQTPVDPAERREAVSGIQVLSPQGTEWQAAFEAGVAIAHGQSLARRLGQMPGNVCTPETFVETGHEMARRLGMTITVWGREQMAEAGMGSFLAVAQGTHQEPRLVALHYNGGPADQKPVVFVGKGLCFDTGGVSIKPALDMEWMKFDMSGAGGVMGAMEAIGRMKLPINAVGVIGSTTNMVSGEAVKPGDVVRASNGKTIEVINTDAEGRLVLADLLVFVRRFNPAIAVDAATLTGAMVIALGHDATGVFGNDEAAIGEVLAAGKTAGEPGWHMPLWDEYKEQLKSDVADLRNVGGRPAGSITAAMFLSQFADGYPWVHLDVAGTAYSQSDLKWIPKGPTGTPVGTFVELARAYAARTR